MPLPFHIGHSHSHSHSSSTPNNAQQLPVGAASGLIQAAQSLGSIGSPAGSLKPHTLDSSGGSTTNSNYAGQSAPPKTYGLQHHNSTTSAVAPPASGAMNQPQSYETPRRNRHPDELHLNPNANAMAAQRGPISPRADYTPGGPRISLEQATPENSQYQNAGQLPGSLQSGRPGPMSGNTAPTLPTIPQSMPQEQYSTPSRSSALGHTHNYTRSSPAAGYDGQAYSPFTPTTPGTDQGQFTSPTSQKYTPQNTQRTVSNTPLGLADIRPRADSGLSDGLPGANPYSYDGANAVPTNSNYLAPWAIYAFDWCKWPAQNHDAGKMAVGSYLEDGHNFVSGHIVHRNGCNYANNDDDRFKFSTRR
jgi:WD repeat-containing protein 68